MKILLVGSNLPMAIERYYSQHLKDQGVDICHFTAPDIILNNYRKSILNKVLFRTNLKTGYGVVNNQLKQIAQNYKPDVIWVFKGMEVYPETLKELGTDFKLANYNPDHPFIIAGKGSGNSNVTKSVGLYHLHFCYHSGLQKQIEECYNIPTVFLPFGYELSEQDYAMATQQQEINRVCFIGNPDVTRVKTILHIASRGFSVDVYGYGWNKTEAKNKNNINVQDAVYGKEFWQKIRQYRIQLNVFRKHNLGSHNMRTFEIPAVGGIQLAPFSEEQSQFFEERKEIFYYRSKEELVDTINYILLMKPQDASIIRKNARERSVSSKYSYAHRALTVLNSFQKNNNRK